MKDLFWDGVLAILICRQSGDHNLIHQRALREFYRFPICSISKPEEQTAFLCLTLLNKWPAQ
jgi:hypothetical protein